MTITVLFSQHRKGKKEKNNCASQLDIKGSEMEKLRFAGSMDRTMLLVVWVFFILVCGFSSISSLPRRVNEWKTDRVSKKCQCLGAQRPDFVV